MQKSQETLPAMLLVGITVRTNNRDEMDPLTAKIGPTVQRYFEGKLADCIQDRLKPGTTICAYTEYESDYTGDYTYFIGEMVSATNLLPPGFKSLAVPSQRYIKLTTTPGPMPDVCIQAWQAIWQMSFSELGGSRSYQTDFEVYDNRAADFEHAILDIYVGIQD